MPTKVIDGTSLLNILHDAGILPVNCCRAVIDIPADSIVKIYYECIGDARLLTIGLPEAMLKIRYVEQR